MPQIRKGGKYVFGWSQIKEDYTLTLPPEALKEYGLQKDTTLITHKADEGIFKRYKGRYYCWLSIEPDGKLKLSADIVKRQNLLIHQKLLVIRSNNIAFTLGAKGTLIDAANEFKEYIPIF